MSNLLSSFVIGDVVLSSSGRAYRVIGFTDSGLVTVAQHGLDADPAIISMNFYPEALTKPVEREVLFHKNGLVGFSL